MAKIWACSGDSHFLEPEGHWKELLPAGYAERMPRAEKISDDEEIVHVDGTSFKRAIPNIAKKIDKKTGMTIGDISMRAPGARDLDARLVDLDEEGIWAEVIYGSLGLWENLIKDAGLVKAAARAQNDWKLEKIQGKAPNRLVPAASIPTLDIQDAVAEVQYAKSIGLHIANLPTSPPESMPDWNRDDWEPLWAAAEEAEMPLGFHVCSDGKDQSTKYRGPGGAVLNYLETTWCGQVVASKLVTCGALDRHPDLKILISEGGSSWVPFMGDRMNESYRQHGGGTGFVRPTLSVLPKEILYRQVYTSFQHDESGPAAMWAMGYRNILWGSDYPHLEGTYGHTQKTLHELFDDVTPEVRQRLTQGSFRELFPHIGALPDA